MISDSISNASMYTASNSKDLGRKKRTNKSAKLKQCKLDARREQWISQLKNKSCKEELSERECIIPVSPLNVGGENRSSGKLKASPRGNGNGRLICHYSDLDSPPNSSISCSSSLISKSSITNYSGNGRSSSSTSSGGSLSGNISEEEDDGCVDDWEAVADALGVNENIQKNPLEILPDKQCLVETDPPNKLKNTSGSGPDKVQKAPIDCLAWRSDDARRPPCLPNLSKQHSMPANSWACNSVALPPLTCPICFEDLDVTEASFYPCMCGFRLCLFCHKRIVDEDGRCPGCRKPYNVETVVGEPSLNGRSFSFRFSRSHSMVTRS